MCGLLQPGLGSYGLDSGLEIEKIVHLPAWPVLDLCQPALLSEESPVRVCMTEQEARC